MKKRNSSEAIKPRLDHVSIPEKFHRTFERLEIRASDGIKVRIESAGILARVYDASPFGFGIKIESGDFSKLQVDSYVTVTMSFPNYSTVEVQAKVCWIGSGDREGRAGFEFQSNSYDKLNQFDAELLTLPRTANLTGYFFAPGAYFERTFIQVIAISPAKMCIRVLDTKVILTPKMKIELFLHLADSKDQIMNLIVDFLEPKAIAESSKEVVVWCKIERMPAEISYKIASYLMAFSSLSIKELEAVGIIVGGLSENLTFRYIWSEADYHDVLKLRFRAYKQAGKVADGKTEADMVSPLDKKSRILVAYHQSKIVASVCLTFPDDDTTLDTERPFGPGGYPKRIPPKSTVMEVARLCTDNDYRGSDLLMRMFEHIYKAMHCGDRSFIITSCDDKLWPLYRRIGFRKMGMIYDHPYLKGIRHHLISIDRRTPDRGERFNPLGWVMLYANMNNYLSEANVLKLPTKVRVKLKLFKVLLTPILNLLQRRSMAKKYQKFIEKKKNTEL